MTNEYTPLLIGGTRHASDAADLAVEQPFGLSAPSPGIFAKLHAACMMWYKTTYMVLGKWFGRPGQLFAINVFCSPTTVLLPFVFVCIFASMLGFSESMVFFISLLAIIPLSAVLGNATETVAEHAGDTVGGLLNATFGNAVELIVSCFALWNGNIRIVQTSLIGSILSNILLVLGCCFIAGGWFGGEQSFAKGGTDIMSSLLSYSCAILVIAAALSYSLSQGLDAADQAAQIAEHRVLTLSRIVSIVLLCCYVCFIFFQLVSHTDLFEQKADPAEQEAKEVALDSARAVLRTAQASYEIADQMSTFNANGTAAVRMARQAVDEAQAVLIRLESEVADESDDESEHEWETPMSNSEAIAVLIFVTGIIAWCAEILVGSIEGMVAGTGISEDFVGVILLPVVGNAAEHVSAVVVAFKKKMDLAIQIAVGSSLQINLFALPAMVIFGWAIGQPMSLCFSIFDNVTFFVSMLMVNSLLSDGKSNYLEGIMCLALYFCIGVGYFLQ